MSSTDEKAIYVDLGERTGPGMFNLAQVKPAKLPSISSLLDSPEHYQSPVRGDATKHSSHPRPRATENSAGQSISPPPLLNQEPTNMQSSLPAHTYFTEVISPRDPRNAQFGEMKRREIEGLLKRGTFKLVMKEELPEKPNIVPSRFVLAIKSVDGDEVLKARYVLGGHMDREKRSVVHNATNLKQSSIRMPVALATILGFNLWSTDINQAYLQSVEKLQRKIFVLPDVLQLDNEQFLQVVKPLYGLSDAGDYWGETLSEHHKKELKMEQATEDFPFSLNV